MASVRRRRVRGTNARGGDGADGDYVVSTESLFPVFLATAVLAAGWAAVLWDTSFLSAPVGAWDMLKYGFLGAYAFVTGMLVRRFFQSDLRPSAYTTAVLRIVLVLLVVAVLHQAARVTHRSRPPARPLPRSSSASSRWSAFRCCSGWCPGCSASSCRH